MCPRPKRHDALLGEVVAAHGGAVFKTVGDSVLAAFARAPDALAARVLQPDLLDREAGHDPARAAHREHVAQIRDKLVNGELDAILHFASPASPADFERIPIPILKAGALGTHNALGLAKAREARFLLASSSEVYGDPLVHPQHEGYRGNVDPIGIRGAYDEAKRYAEAITMAYHRHHGVDTRIARLFNTFGPAMRPDDGRVVPSFVCRALAGEPLAVHGDGSQTRSIQYVDDLIGGLLRLMESEEIRPVNLGNPDEMTVLEIAEMVVDISGSAGGISFGPLPPGDPKRRCPDITRARESLGWEPEISAREGLRRTLAWFAGNLELYASDG